MKPAWNIWDLRDQAKRRLPRGIWEFIERGSENEFLIRHNLDALEQIRLNPRTLRDVSSCDQSIDLFGKKRVSPLIIAPTGIADLTAYRGERALASAAAKAGLPFSLATSSTNSIGDIAAIAQAGFWMQFYLWERRDLSWQIVERAEKAGAEALILTVDTARLPNREFNKRNGMANPIRPNRVLAFDILAHPRWSVSVLGRYMLGGGLPQFANYPREIGSSMTGPVQRQTNSASVCWDDVAELRKRWPRTLIIKGILNAEDARMAVEHGADGISVSNHGGRNFDPAPAAIHVLPEIVDTVGKQATVLFDSGIRRGTDVLKALAIGAKAVLIGRASLYGLAAGGEEGASHAISILRDEIDMAMALMGITRLDQLDRTALRADTHRRWELNNER